MIADMVIDTNVFVHADNPMEARCAASRSLLQRILSVGTILRVDEGYDSNEARNRSHIGSEYQHNLRFGSMGLAVLVQLAGQGRIRTLPRKVPDAATAKKIRQLLRNTTDRVFLSVAYGSHEKILVSHDYVDFQEAKRPTIREVLGVAVIEACACEPRL